MHDQFRIDAVYSPLILSAVIEAGEEGMTAPEISEGLGYGLSNTCAILNALEDRGLVQRLPLNEPAKYPHHRLRWRWAPTTQGHHELIRQRAQAEQERQPDSLDANRAGEVLRALAVVHPHLADVLGAVAERIEAAA